MSFNFSQYISKLLNLIDPNLIFSENISKGLLYNLQTTFLEATLTYAPTSCPHCKNNHPKTLIKHGFKKTTTRLLSLNGEPAALKLKKQRFRCKQCSSTFTASTPVVDKFCSISNSLKAHILHSLSKKISEKDIASLNYVSHATVSRYVDKNFKYYAPSKEDLPEHLSFDEFKSTKDAKGHMSFILTDAKDKKAIDIVENRQLPYLRRYFQSFSKQARNQVKTITIDMYPPYISLIKTFFPKAHIIFDRFHILNHLSRALAKTRITEMKKLSPSSMEYKRLKRYWKTIQKDRSTLEAYKFRSWVHFHEWKTEKGMVDACLEVSPLLKKTYEIYQTLLKDVQKKDSASLKQHLSDYLNQGSGYLKTAMSTLLHAFEYVENALTFEYSNGFTEGMNNLIKLIKRIAFGYKSFFHFRNRILITLKLKEQLGY